MNSTKVYIVLIYCSIWMLWAIAMTHFDNWHLFEDNGFMSITMLFGSFVAGATSEGGGAVAFPVMTLLFKIAPPIARDFSLMIQSVGMTAATLAILLSRTPIVRSAVVFSGLGGAFGMIVGLEFIAPLIIGAYAKVLFTSLWLSFALALFWINRDHKRPVLKQIQGYSPLTAVLLFGIGLVGGIISSVLGSGLDIITFAVLVLGFRICEAVATPTSVILMASNAVVGMLWKGVIGEGLIPQAWDYWWVCVPIVIIGAPLGAWFIRRISRKNIAMFLIASIVVQYVVALLIIQQTPMLLAFNAAVLMIGVACFAMINHVGKTWHRELLKK